MLGSSFKVSPFIPSPVYNLESLKICDGIRCPAGEYSFDLTIMDLLDSSHFQIRASWIPDSEAGTCVITSIHITKLNVITTLITDIALLLIMLIGLLRLGFYEPDVFSLGHLMWRQVGCPRFSQVVMFVMR